MPKKEVRRHDRYVHLAWAAIGRGAGATPGSPNPIIDESLAERTGVIIGSGIGGINTMIRDVIEAHDLGVERIGPFLVTALIPDMGAGYVAINANARGPNYATVSACSSSNHAIGDALNIIRRGDADVMIAGGAEAGIGEIPVAAFARHARRSRPSATTTPAEGVAALRRATATASSWPRAPACSSSRRSSTPRRAAPASTPSWSATAPPTTPPTSPCRPRAGAARSRA